MKQCILICLSILLFACGYEEDSSDFESSSSKSSTLELSIYDTENTTSSVSFNTQTTIPNQINSADLVSFIIVTIEDEDGNMVVDDQVYSTIFSGTTAKIDLVNLPLEEELTFLIKAYDSNNKPIYEGSTVKELFDFDEDIELNLFHESFYENYGSSSLLNSSFPQSIQPGKNQSLDFQVFGEVGEEITISVKDTLEFSDILDVSKTVTLKSRIALVKIPILLPSLNGEVPLQVSFQGSSTSSSSNFSINIAGVRSIDRRQKPKYNGIIIDRSGDTLIITTNVSDDSTTLAYDYSYSGPDSLYFNDNTFNPTTLLNYSDSVTGVVSVTVTDEDGIELKRSVKLEENKHPENDLVQDPALNPKFPEIEYEMYRVINTLVIELDITDDAEILTGNVTADYIGSLTPSLQISGDELYVHPYDQTFEGTIKIQVKDQTNLVTTKNINILPDLFLDEDHNPFDKLIYFGGHRYVTPHSYNTDYVYNFCQEWIHVKGKIYKCINPKAQIDENGYRRMADGYNYVVILPGFATHLTQDEMLYGYNYYCGFIGGEYIYNSVELEKVGENPNDGIWVYQNELGYNFISKRTSPHPDSHYISSISCEVSK